MLKIDFEDAQLLLDDLESSQRILLYAPFHPIEGRVEKLPELVVTDSFGTAVRTEGEIRSYVAVAGMAGRELTHTVTINPSAGAVQS